MLQPTVSRLNVSNHYTDLMCEVLASAQLLSNVAGSVDRSYSELHTWEDKLAWPRCADPHVYCEPCMGSVATQCSVWDAHMGSVIPLTTTAVPFYYTQPQADQQIHEFLHHSASSVQTQ